MTTLSTKPGTLNARHTTGPGPLPPGTTKRVGTSCRTRAAATTSRHPGHLYLCRRRPQPLLARPGHPRPYWSRPMPAGGRSMVARMPRHGLAPPLLAQGLGSATRLCWPFAGYSAGGKSSTRARLAPSRHGGEVLMCPLEMAVRAWWLPARAGTSARSCPCSAWVPEGSSGP